MFLRAAARHALVSAAVLLTGGCLDGAPPSRAALVGLLGEEIALDRIERLHGRLYDIHIRSAGNGPPRRVRVRWVDREWEIVDPSGTAARLRFL